MENEQKSIDASIEAELPDHVGEIVLATCESIAEKRCIWRFASDQLVSVSKDEFVTMPRIGDSHEVYIEGRMKNGMWGGSIDKIQPFRLWQRLENGQKSDTDFEATLIATEPNGWICDMEGLAAFMPKREWGDSPLSGNAPIGQKIKVRILKLSVSNGQIIVSHRAAVAQALREAREAILTELKVGQQYAGRVRQIVDYGVFVDIGAGVEGLVHRSNLSWANDEPANCVSIGDSLDVVVLAVEKGRISLGHKQLVKDNWADNAESLSPGDIVEGKVTTFTNFGAFVRLPNGLEGLIHNTELSWDESIRHPKQILNLGDVVRVRIIDVDKEKRRLRLSLRRLQDDPWQTVKQNFPVGTKTTLPVAGIADFGIFLDMGNHIRGLVHKSDISWLDEKIDLSQTYTIGQEVECVVLDIDANKHRAALGIKQLSDDPWDAFMAMQPLGKQLKATIKRIAKFGAFATIESTPFDGLIHISELSENHIENVSSVVKLGQEVTATVVQIDPQKRRIGLSLIAEPFTPSQAQTAPQADSPNEASPVQPPTMADIFPDILKPHNL